MASRILTITNASVKLGAVPVSGDPYDVDCSTLTDFQCQVTSAAITASPNTADTPATFCSPAGSKAVLSSYNLNLDGLQDWGSLTDSLSEFLFKNDGKEAAFCLFLDGTNEPKAQGIISVSAGDFGGAAGEALTFSTSFPVKGRPVINDHAGQPLIPRTRQSVAPGATVADPGVTGGANDVSYITAKYVANPLTAWTTGQAASFNTHDYHWDGAAWVAGVVP
jgi:hypothetical protein